MPDLLTHALLAYSVSLVLSWRLGWLDRSYLTAAMVGAMLPDLAKMNLLVDSWTISQTLSIPFSWTALHTAGGVTLSGLALVLLVGRPYRRRVALVVAVGGSTHLVADALLRSVTGRSYPVLWPLTGYEPPTPGLYLSTDPWVALVAGGLALALTAVDRYLVGWTTDPGDGGAE